jgi:hypothetical protein
MFNVMTRKKNKQSVVIKGKGKRQVRQVAPQASVPKRKVWGDVLDAGIGALGGFGGTMLAGPAGGAAGGMLGSAAGSALSKLFGWGAYGQPWTVKGNSLVTQGNIPAMHALGDSGMRVVHKEYAFPVYSTTGFNCFSYPINPGMDQLFPWLCQIAQNFQSYKLMGMVVCFKSAVPEGLAAFGSMGQVIIAADQNPSAISPQYQTQMEQMQFVTSGKPSESLVGPIECSPNGSGSQGASLLVRTGALAANQVLNNYDHGVLHVATIGQPAAGVLLGSVYTSYDIVMLNPTSYPEGSTGHGARYTNTTGCDATHPFGTTYTKVYDTYGLTFDATSVTFPIGTHGRILLTWYAYGNSTAGLTFPAVTFTNAVLGFQQVSPWTNDTARCMMTAVDFVVTDPNLATKVTFGVAGTLPAVITDCRVMATSVPF